MRWLFKYKWLLLALTIAAAIIQFKYLPVMEAPPDAQGVFYDPGQALIRPYVRIKSTANNLRKDGISVHDLHSVMDTHLKNHPQSGWVRKGDLYQRDSLTMTGVREFQADKKEGLIGLKISGLTKTDCSFLASSFFNNVSKRMSGKIDEASNPWYKLLIVNNAQGGRLEIKGETLEKARSITQMGAPQCDGVVSLIFLGL